MMAQYQTVFPLNSTPPPKNTQSRRKFEGEAKSEAKAQTDDSHAGSPSKKRAFGASTKKQKKVGIDPLD